jgi:adenosylcobinamide-GDP ribazoletransferase
VAVAVAFAVVVLLVQRAVHRFGGVTGDVLGAAVEVALAALLVAFA